MRRILVLGMLLMVLYTDRLGSFMVSYSLGLSEHLNLLPQNHDRQLWELGTLPPGLITFRKRTHPIDGSWHVLGLGYDPSISLMEIERAAVIDYNGYVKPWLEIGIPKYRSYWAKYVDYDHAYLRECNTNPAIIGFPQK